MSGAWRVAGDDPCRVDGENGVYAVKARTPEIARAVVAAHNAQGEAHIAQLKDALSAALEWIDAVPNSVAYCLPIMPGFDRDWADGLLAGTTAPPPPVDALAVVKRKRDNTWLVCDADKHSDYMAGFIAGRLAAAEEIIRELEGGK